MLPAKLESPIDRANSRPSVIVAWLLAAATFTFFVINVPMLSESVGHLARRAAIAGMNLPITCRIMLNLGDPAVALIAAALAGLPIFFLLSRPRQHQLPGVAIFTALFFAYFATVRWSMEFPERESLQPTPRVQD